MSFCFFLYIYTMFIRRTDNSPVQKEFGLFGFLTGTGANAYETRRDLGNGYSEVTKNTLGNKISNFFNGTKKVRNQGYVPGVNETSYRDGGVFAKIGNKAKAGYNSMKNSVSNALKSSNAMTPTGVVPKKMTKNPQATQLELFNRDGSPAFEANKPTRLQKKSAAIGGQAAAMSGGLMFGPSNFEKKLAEDYHKTFVKNASPSAAAKRAFKFDESKEIIPRTISQNSAVQPAPAFDKIRNRSGNFVYTSKNSRQKRVEKYHDMLNNSRLPASTPQSLAIPSQAVNTDINKVSRLTTNNRRLINGVKNARLGRGYFGNLGSVKRLIRR